ncbi:MAG: hypothetical protein ACK415_03020 [Thermodesulfovibrionales bacterium]
MKALLGNIRSKLQNFDGEGQVQPDTFHADGYEDEFLGYEAFIIRPEDSLNSLTCDLNL